MKEEIEIPKILWNTCIKNIKKQWKPIVPVVENMLLIKIQASEKLNKIN